MAVEHFRDDVIFERKITRRNRLQPQIFPTSWLVIPEQNVSYYQRLSASERKELHGNIYATWARVLGNEFAILFQQTATDQPTLIDKYGATKPAEFFAVVTEYFFEKPNKLWQRHPELYEEPRRFYRQDPAKTDSVESPTGQA